MGEKWSVRTSGVIQIRCGYHLRYKYSFTQNELRDFRVTVLKCLIFIYGLLLY